MDINIRFTIDAPKGWLRRVMLFVATPAALVAGSVAVASAYDTGWIESGMPISAASLAGLFEDVQTDVDVLTDDLELVDGRVFALEAIEPAELPRSSVFYTATAGYGSAVGNRILRWSNKVAGSGALSNARTANATDGDYFTIPEDGVYDITLTASRTNGTGNFGISIDSDELTTPIDNLDNSARRAFFASPVANQPGTGHAALFLAAGTVLRAHADGNEVLVGSDRAASILITKISN